MYNSKERFSCGHLEFERDWVVGCCTFPQGQFQNCVCRQACCLNMTTPLGRMDTRLFMQIRFMNNIFQCNNKSSTVCLQVDVAQHAPAVNRQKHPIPRVNIGINDE